MNGEAEITPVPFVLAPTPAQLGKAPLQRRQSQGNILPLSFTPVSGAPTLPEESEASVSSASEEMQKCRLTRENQTVPEIVTTTPEPTDENDLQNEEEKMETDKEDSTYLLVPGAQKGFFKKNVEDGMDRLGDGNY